MTVPVLALCLAVASSVGFRPQHVGPGVDGVWRLVDIESSDGAIISRDVPGLILFTKSYYSITRATSPTRGSLDRAGFATANAEELRNVLEFVGEAGTYTATESTIVLTRITALVPANSPGTSVTYSVIVTGREILLTQQTMANGAKVSSNITLRLMRAE